MACAICSDKSSTCPICGDLKHPTGSTCAHYACVQVHLLFDRAEWWRLRDPKRFWELRRCAEAERTTVRVRAELLRARDADRAEKRRAS